MDKNGWLIVLGIALIIGALFLPVFLVYVWLPMIIGGMIISIRASWRI